jgi:hypothetical protein
MSSREGQAPGLSDFGRDNLPPEPGEGKLSKSAIYSNVSMMIVLMGVTGSGKTTVGRLLAEDLGWTYFDADDFHSELNIEKMKGGAPLSDADRKPWLEGLRELVRDVYSEVRTPSSRVPH